MLEFSVFTQFRGDKMKIHSQFMKLLIGSKPIKSRQKKRLFDQISAKSQIKQTKSIILMVYLFDLPFAVNHPKIK